MLVEGLGQVTFINGILRVQTLAVSHNGQVTETGSIEIPGNKVGDIINALTQGATEISNKIGEEGAQPKADEKKEKSSEKNKKKKK